MKVLHAAAEIFPLVKTGGLADVVAALPVAENKLGADVRLILPGLPAIIKGLEIEKTVCEMAPVFGADKITLRLGRMPQNGLMIYVVDAPNLFQRTGNPYLASNNMAWPDNAERFALLGFVAAQLALGELDPFWSPDVLHAHDWHAAMSCAYIAAQSKKVASVFTIHNLAYQGLFPPETFHKLNLPAHFMVPEGLEFYDQLSFMKAGIRYAQKVTTVSPKYAEEIATQEFGHGLEGLIKARRSNISGILNGVDEEIWNPATDAFIEKNYSLTKFSGKALCKEHLQTELGLPREAAAPLFAVISRLTSQKGLDLLLGAIPVILHAHPDAQFVIQGNGDSLLEAAFARAAMSHPKNVVIRYEYDESLAHRVMAGADLLIVPSRFEPCGLTQLYALRYGTVPVVRRVGGLADTVIDVTSHPDLGTGFSFGPANTTALVKALEEALAVYRQPLSWEKIITRGMSQNFSWIASANQYMALYNEAIRSLHKI